MMAVEVTHIAGMIESTSPKRHLRSSFLRKFFPETITEVPPLSGPADGLACKSDMVGENVNWTPSVVKSPPSLKLISSETDPESWAEDLHVMLESEIKLATVTVEVPFPFPSPKRQSAPGAKFGAEVDCEVRLPLTPQKP